MTTNYNKVKTEGVEEFDRTFVSDSPDFPLEKFWKQTNEDTIELKKHKDFAFSLAEKVHKATLEDVYEKLDKNYLGYCREHNGLPYCKNCGLDLEELKTLTK